MTACGKPVVSPATGRTESCPKRRGHLGGCGEHNTRASRQRRRQFDRDLQGAIDRAFPPSKKRGRR